MSIPDRPSNPCRIFGMTLAKGAELIAGILITLKGTYLMAVVSNLAALKLGWDHWPFNDNPVTENLLMHELYNKMPWLLIDAFLSFITEWILLLGIWRKTRGLCYVWLCTNTIKGFRMIFLGPQKSISSLIVRAMIGLYEYWVIWTYSEELEREEILGNLIPEPIPIVLNVICTIAFFLEIYIIFWDPLGVSSIIIFMPRPN